MELYNLKKGAATKAFKNNESPSKVALIKHISTFNISTFLDYFNNANIFLHQFAIMNTSIFEEFLSSLETHYKSIQSDIDYNVLKCVSPVNDVETITQLSEHLSVKTSVLTLVVRGTIRNHFYSHMIFYSHLNCRKREKFSS